MSDPLPEVADAIHTLFFATEAAHRRYLMVEASLTTEKERAALRKFSIGIVNFDPIPQEALDWAAKHAKEEGWA